MTLQLPRLLHGRYRDVRPRLMRIARRMRRGEEWIPLVEKHGFLDVASTPGYVVGDGPSPLLGAEEHFQMWLLWMLARDGGLRDIPDIGEDIFQRSLSRPWTVLGLVMPYSRNWLYQESHHHPFLRAVQPHWDDFASIGPRYTLGSRMAQELWQLANSVKYVLANQGVERERLLGRMTGSDIAGFIRELGIEPAVAAGESSAG